MILEGKDAHRTMKMTQKELYHLLFLSDVVLSGKKVELMEDTLKCLMYVTKSLDEVELTESVAEQIKQLTSKIETVLREENERTKEVNHIWNKQFMKRQ
jgi:hypothetical protein